MAKADMGAQRDDGSDGDYMQERRPQSPGFRSAFQHMTVEETATSYTPTVGLRIIAALKWLLTALLWIVTALP